MEKVKCFFIVLFFGIIFYCFYQVITKESFAEPEREGLDYETHLANIIKHGQQSQTQVNWANEHDPGDLFKDAQGWWADTIDCENSAQHSLYCKPKEKWCFPY